MPPLSLYVHLPWCVRKCPYCDFNSFEARGTLPEEHYVDALLRDLDTELSRLPWERPIESVFIGGGTPSLFSGDTIARLIAAVRARTALITDCEITLEANPGTAEAARFAAYRGAGVNRLSLGIQSLRDDRLAALGRVHNGREAIDSVAMARAAGFTNINIDLMYALPGDDVAGSLQDLAAGLALEPTHLSWYQLTLEPDTAFHRRPPPLPDEDVVLEIEKQGRALLAEHRFERYEISAYARAGARCAHNLNYWRFGDYVGIGAGAHGKVTTAPDGSFERRSKQRNPRAYVESAGTTAATTTERVAAKAQINVEFLMNALRLTDGTGFDLFEARTGQSLRAIARPVAEARRRGWLADDADRLRATPAGLQVLNRMLELF